MAIVHLLLFLAFVFLAASQRVNITGIYTNTTTSTNITTSGLTSTGVASISTSSSSTFSSSTAALSVFTRPSSFSTDSPSVVSSLTARSDRPSTSTVTSFAQGVGPWILQGLGASLASPSIPAINGTASIYSSRQQASEPPIIANTLNSSSSTSMSSLPTSATNAPQDIPLLASGNITDNPTTVSASSLVATTFGVFSTPLNTSMGSTTIRHQSSIATGTTPGAFKNNSTMGSAPYAWSNATVSNITKAKYSTAALNSPIAATGSGSMYANQCQDLWNAWSSVAESVKMSYVTKVTTSYFSQTNWTAQITTLGGCDTRPRLLGTFTPTASTVYTYNATSLMATSTPGPTPTCNINPSDCDNLFLATSSARSSYTRENAAANTMLILATSATALTMINADTTSITTFSKAEMTPAPVLTINSTEYYPTVTTHTYASPNTSVQTLTNYRIGTATLNEVNSTNLYRYIPDMYFPDPMCNRTKNSTSCGACTIYGGTVELLYFPTTANASRDMCAAGPGPAGSPTNCPLGPTTAPYTPAMVDLQNSKCPSYANCPYLYTNVSTTDSGPFTVSDGHTFYANRAYISLQTAYASNSCGLVGKPHAGSIVTMASSQVHSIFHLNPRHPGCYDFGYSFNFANLLPNVPWSAWDTGVYNTGCQTISASGYPSMGADYVNGKPMDLGFCNTVVDLAYFPTLVVPTQIRGLDPAWTTCAIALEGLYDPPKALTVQTTLDGPSGPGVQTTTAASPASTINNNSPTPTGAITTTASSTQPAHASSTANADQAASTAKSLQQAVSSAYPGSSGASASAGSSGAADPGTSGGSDSAQSRSANLGAAGSILNQALSSTASGNVATTANGVFGGSSASIGGSGQGTFAGATGSTIASQGSGNNGVAASQGSGSNSGSGAGSNVASSAPADPSTLYIGSSAFTVMATTQSAGVAVVIANGGTAATLEAGQKTLIGGQEISADSTGDVVIGSGSAAATVAPGSSDGSGSGSHGAQPSGAVIGVGSSSLVTAVQTVVTGANGQATTQAVVGGSKITQGGSAATINGQTISIASGGVVIGSSTQAISALLASSSTSSGAVVQIGSSSLTAVQTVFTGSDGQATTQAVIGGSTITQGGAAATINGQIVSLASNGVVVGTSTEAFSGLPVASTSGAVVQIGSSSLTAVQSVVTGSNGQLTTQAVIDGTTVTQGAAAATVNGQVVSLGPSGLVVGGSTTQEMSALVTNAASSGAVLTFGSSLVTASQTVVTGSNGQRNTEAIIAGNTLTQGGSAAVVSGHTVSLGSNGLVIDGGQTFAISALITGSAITGALVTLGSSTLTASQTIVTGANGQRTTEVIIGSSTLVSGGSPVTISGHTMTYGSSGILVDATQTDLVSTFPTGITATPIVFTEHGQVFTATPVPGSPGVYIMNGQTISAGGAQVTVDALTLTAQPSGLVVDGTQTVSFSGSGGESAPLAAASGPSVASTGRSAAASSTSKSSAERMVVEKIMGSLLLAGLVVVMVL